MLRKNWKTVFMIFLLMLFVFPSCDWLKNIFSPNPPDDPVEPYIPTEFEPEVKVTYIRDPSKIKNPSGNDAGVDANYQLCDPKQEYSDISDVTYHDGFRLGAVGMIKIDEDRFECKLNWVLIQSDPSHKKHIVFIKDPKLAGDGQSKYTSDGTSLQNSYDTEIRAYYIYFKQAKIQNLQ